jgi:DNA repair photolyase
MRSPKGRGSARNPRPRFGGPEFIPDPDEAIPLPRTTFIPDHARTILTTNESPDLGFEASVNPYRGCEHGCAYCYARPYHEYLGYSAGLDFETKILVKERAAELLRDELASPRWVPKPVALSGVTDPYQPVERRLGITRACLEVFAAFRNPVIVITKNRLVGRDADLLADLASHRAACVFLSITTLDAGLAGALEPRTSVPQRRLDAIRLLADAGVPVGVNVAPIIPGLTDHEAPAILKAAREAGATFAGYGLLRLPHGVKDLFVEWLEAHEAGRKGKVLHRLEGTRGGRLNDPRFGTRFTGEGGYARQIGDLFALSCRKTGLAATPPELSTSAFRGPQLMLF